MTVFVDRRTSGLTLLSVEAIDGVRGGVCDAGRQKPGDDEMLHPEGGQAWRGVGVSRMEKRVICGGTMRGAID